MKKILSILLSAVIILSGLTFAFADDPEEASDSSSGNSAYTFEEQSFIDHADSDTDKDLRTLSVEVVRASSSTYTLDDIYNLLLSVYTTYTGRASWAVFDQSIYNLIINNFSHYDSVSGNTYDVGSMLWIIRNSLLELANTLVPATSTSPTIYSLINNINDTLSLALVDANNTPYLVNIYNKLVDIESGFIDYTSALFYNSVGVAEYASRINSAIVASYNGLSTQLNKLDTTNDKLTTINTSLQTKLTALNTHAQTIESKIDSQTNTISNDLSSSGAIASGINSLQFDINNIDWSQTYNGTNLFTFLGKANSLDNALNDVFFNESLSNDIYYVFKPNFLYQSMPRGILRFVSMTGLNNDIYSSQYNDINVDIYLGSTKVKPKYISYSNNSMYHPIYLSGIPWFYSITNKFIIHYSSSQKIHASGTGSLTFLNENSNDYYDVLDFVIQSQNLNVIKKFEDIYASDDLINAKENQQSYENQVVSDFTGSGSAAAKASDASSAKDISSAVSSGLNSGGSVNNSLNVFNPSGGFWGWFSQENSDLINTLSSQNRLRSSGSGLDWVIDDPYQRNAEELQSILGGDR